MDEIENAYRDAMNKRPATRPGKKLLFVVDYLFLLVMPLIFVGSFCNEIRDLRSNY